MTTATHKMAKRDNSKFPVAIRRITNENPIAAVIPVVADAKNALSDSIQHQKTPAV